MIEWGAIRSSARIGGPSKHARYSGEWHEGFFGDMRTSGSAVFGMASPADTSGDASAPVTSTLVAAVVLRPASGTLDVRFVAFDAAFFTWDGDTASPSPSSAACSFSTLSQPVNLSLST